MRLALASLLLLAACQSGEETNNQSANVAAPAPGPETPAAAAERLVRARIGSAGEARFADASAGTREGVTIVCGAYMQGSARHRYIVINGEDVFIEPEMGPGEMARAVAEFCGNGERG
ncbi:MAG: hypothetical protein ACT4N8_10860 [Sphingosinicella sp.]|uniref:hypothetical protein n=1 Tax=Sphingosinicella sp. TaxID=1917971 RepID=UPI0040379BCC